MTDAFIILNDEMEAVGVIFKGERKGTPLWGTHRLKVLKHYGLRL